MTGCVTRPWGRTCRVAHPLGWWPFVSAQFTHSGAHQVPDSFVGFSDVVGLDLPAMSAQTAQQVRYRLVSRDFDAWSEAVARVGNCAHSIRLQGSSDTINKATGEIVSSCTSC